MAPLTEEEKVALQKAVLAQLAPTPFACTTPFEALTNGTTNFVFRGRLATPQPDGAISVIIKHTTEYAAVNKDLPLDPSRSIYEETMLHALGSFPQTSLILTSPSKFTVKAPRLLWFDRATNTQVLKDFPDAIDLKATLLASVEALPGLHPLTTSPALAHSIGEALGAWLRLFHAWTSAPGPDRSALRKAITSNEPMRRLKHQITYDAILRVVAQFPSALRDNGPILEAVQAMAAAEFEKRPREGDENDMDWGIIHGDFWSGNILLPSTPQFESSSPAQQLFIIDWEFAQYGHCAYDIGQLIGDLIERNHFRGAAASLNVLAGFVSGYGFPFTCRDGDDKDSNRLAFRVATHAGVQIIGCYIRRAPTGPLPGTPEQTEEAIKLGVDFVVKGWARDREWFKESVLAALFV